MGSKLLGISLVMFMVSLFLISCKPSSTEDILAINLKEHKNLAMHIHPTVEIEIYGEKYMIPANIGISENGMNVIHTHETDGNLHVESPFPHQFYLKDFFTIWGRNFNSSCIFEYCDDSEHDLIVYLNGVENIQYGDIPLFDKDKIKIVYIKE